MSTTAQPATTSPPDGAGTIVPPHGFVHRFHRQRLAVVALWFLVLIGLVVVLAPLIAPHDPNAIDVRRVLEGPSAEHLLGTDDLGRDVLSRLLFAGRISLLAAVEAVGIALLLGVPLGLISGYVGGWVDTVIMRFNDALMSFPALILAIAIIGFLGPSVTNAMVAIGIVYAPRLMRVVRGSVLSVREETYIEASRSIGCSPYRMIRRHVLPNVLSPLIVQTTLSLGLAILAEASLSFIGLGVQPPEASWGAMLGRSFAYLAEAPLFVISPGIAITLVVLSFNVVGDGLRDALGRDRRG